MRGAWRIRSCTLCRGLDVEKHIYVFPQEQTAEAWVLHTVGEPHWEPRPPATFHREAAPLGSGDPVITATTSCLRLSNPLMT
jgi:hypothetical protein